MSQHDQASATDVRLRTGRSSEQATPHAADPDAGTVLDMPAPDAARPTVRRRKAGDGLTDQCRAGDHDACPPGADAIAADGYPTSCGCGHHYGAGPARIR